MYDLDAGSWLDETVSPVLNNARYKQACAVNNDKIYVLGGKAQGEEMLDSVEYTNANMTSKGKSATRLDLERSKTWLRVLLIRVSAFTP